MESHYYESENCLRNWSPKSTGDSCSIGAPAQNELDLLELAFSYSACVPLGSSAYGMVLSIRRACLSHLLFCLPMLPSNSLRSRQKVGFTNVLGISQFTQVDSQRSPHRESGGFRYPVFLHSVSHSLLCQSSSSLLNPHVIVAICLFGHRTGWFQAF